MNSALTERVEAGETAVVGRVDEAMDAIEHRVEGCVTAMEASIRPHLDALNEEMEKTRAMASGVAQRIDGSADGVIGRLDGFINDATAVLRQDLIAVLGNISASRTPATLPQEQVVITALDLAKVADTSARIDALRTENEALKRSRKKIPSAIGQSSA